MVLFIKHMIKKIDKELQLKRLKKNIVMKGYLKQHYEKFHF